jgi:hypothetical protein
MASPTGPRILFSSVVVAVLLAHAALAQQPGLVRFKGNSQGDVSFLPAVVYDTGGTEATFVAVGDFNGDGKPDLAVANSYYSNTIGILVGNSDGTFQPAVSYDSGGGFPATIIPVDLNGDGKLDLVVANQSQCYPCGQNGVISVLLGNGDGTFQQVHTYDSGGQGFANSGFGTAEIAVADVNGDGKADVVVVNCASKSSAACGDGDGAISVLLGNGDGSFQPAVSQNSGAPHIGTGIVLADLNGDGKPDLVITNNLCLSSTDCPGEEVGILLGNGDGTFKPTVGYPSGGWSNTGISVADLNGDGKPDLVVAGCGSSDCWVGNGVIGVLLGNGDGTFQLTGTYSTGGRLGDGITIADLNGDGQLDVVVANVIDFSVGVLLGNGDGTFQPAITYPSGGNYTYSVAVQDVNGDGKPDILVTSCAVGIYCGGSNPGAVGVLLNNTPERDR